MNMNSLVKGLVIGAAVGTAAYALSSSSVRQKRRVKKNAGKALRAVGTVIEGVSCMMK